MEEIDGLVLTLTGGNDASNLPESWSASGSGSSLCVSHSGEWQNEAVEESSDLLAKSL
jgi:hypothetical protein